MVNALRVFINRHAGVHERRILVERVVCDITINHRNNSDLDDVVFTVHERGFGVQDQEVALLGQPLVGNHANSPFFSATARSIAASRNDEYRTRR